MKKVILLVLALIVGCVIFMFVYNQRQNAQLVQKLNNLPDDVVTDIENAREALSENIEDEDEIIEEINRDMTKIKDDYRNNIGDDMPEDVEGAIEEELVTQAIEKE